MSDTPVLLIVLDGWGINAEKNGNAIALARTPVYTSLLADYPHTELRVSGLAVGLPDGQMGNSEVGHLNLGAGRVVPQDIVRISTSIRSGAFYSLSPFLELGARLRETGGTLHLIGLIGNGGVHALDTQLLGCVELGLRLEAPRIAIHGFLDGRDTAPTSAARFLGKLSAQLSRLAGPRA